MVRDQNQRDFQGRKRVGEAQEVRDVRRMTEEDLRHKIEDHRRGYIQHQNWGVDTGQSSGLPMRCFNCNDYGYH